MSNRELKFRVWDKSRKEMTHDSWVVSFNGKVTTTMPAITIHGFDRDNSQDFDFEILQFTGLKDSKGREIFEGDILDFKARYKNNYPAAVIVHGSSFGCIVSDDRNLKEFWDLNDVVQFNPIVIGNINENPELLK